MAAPKLPNGLTARQEKFAVTLAHFILSPETKGSASAAYKIAYPNKMNPNSIYVEASRLLDNPKVSLRVQQELKNVLDRASKHAEMDLAYWLRSVKENLEHCLQKSPIKDKRGNDLYIYDAAAANRALELLGKHLGAIKDQPALHQEVHVTTIEVHHHSERIKG